MLFDKILYAFRDVFTAGEPAVDRAISAISLLCRLISCSATSLIISVSPVHNLVRCFGVLLVSLPDQSTACDKGSQGNHRHHKVDPLAIQRRMCAGRISEQQFSPHVNTWGDVI